MFNNQLNHSIENDDLYGIYEEENSLSSSDDSFIESVLIAGDYVGDYPGTFMTDSNYNYLYYSSKEEIQALVGNYYSISFSPTGATCMKITSISDSNIFYKSGYGYYFTYAEATETSSSYCK